jgi:hypothetical protein
MRSQVASRLWLAVRAGQSKRVIVGWRSNGGVSESEELNGNTLSTKVTCWEK